MKGELCFSKELSPLSDTQELWELRVPSLKRLFDMKLQLQGPWKINSWCNSSSVNCVHYNQRLSSCGKNPTKWHHSAWPFWKVTSWKITECIRCRCCNFYFYFPKYYLFSSQTNRSPSDSRVNFMQQQPPTNIYWASAWFQAFSQALGIQKWGEQTQSLLHGRDSVPPVSSGYNDGCDGRLQGECLTKGPCIMFYGRLFREGGAFKLKWEEYMGVSQMGGGGIFLAEETTHPETEVSSGMAHGHALLPWANKVSIRGLLGSGVPNPQSPCALPGGDGHIFAIGGRFWISSIQWSNGLGRYQRVQKVCDLLLLKQAQLQRDSTGWLWHQPTELGWLLFYSSMCFRGQQATGALAPCGCVLYSPHDRLSHFFFLPLSLPPCHLVGRSAWTRTGHHFSGLGIIKILKKKKWWEYIHYLYHHHHRVSIYWTSTMCHNPCWVFYIYFSQLYGKRIISTFRWEIEAQKGQIQSL